MSEITDEQTSSDASVQNVSTKNIDTKKTFREKVWLELIKKRQGAFPLPPFGKIPNFKGAREAAAKLLEIPEFKAAQAVEVNPDKPLEFCRQLVLEQGKALYVPVPQLRGSLLKKLEKNEKYEVYKITSRWGIDTLGKEVNLNDEIQIDLLIIGSVAVSKDGYRIGKGKGYADLEFGLLKELKVINNETVIITVVHDLQVFDELPSNLFQTHDVPVDIIVTPTQIIRVQTKLPKPDGIYWNMLTSFQVQKIDSLKILKERHESEGKDVTLSTENKNKKPSVRRYYTSGWGRKPRNNSTNEANKENESSDKETNGTDAELNGTNSENKTKPNKEPRSRKSRPFRRNTEEGMQNEKGENIVNTAPKFLKKKKYQDGYSLRVSNIEKTVRARDFKSALGEKGVLPNSVVWRGYRGFCDLYYSTKKKDPENREDFSIDNLIETIQGIKINPTSEQDLDVVVMDPITRIETVNVTSV